MMRDVCLLELPLGIDLSVGASPGTIKRHVGERLALALSADPLLIRRHLSRDDYSLAMVDGRLVARFLVPKTLQRQLLDSDGRPVRGSSLAQDVNDLAQRVDTAVARGAQLLDRVVEASLAEVPADAISEIEQEVGVSTGALRRYLGDARVPLEIGTVHRTHRLEPVAVRANYVRADTFDVLADVLAWPNHPAGLQLRVREVNPAGTIVRELMARRRVTGHLDPSAPPTWRLAAATAYAYERPISLRARVIESTRTCRPQALAVDGVNDLHFWLAQPPTGRRDFAANSSQTVMWSGGLTSDRATLESMGTDASFPYMGD